MLLFFNFIFIVNFIKRGGCMGMEEGNSFLPEQEVNLYFKGSKFLKHEADIHLGN
jgi:hypothetical protein